MPGLRTLEYRKKMSESCKRSWKKRVCTYKPTLEHKRNLSLAHLGKCYAKGKKHHAWKSGVIKMNSRGYLYQYAPEHPYCTIKGYVAQHRLVAEKKIGRYLKRGEVVHHINGNTKDNKPSNLEVMTNSEHASYHRKCRLAA